MNEHLEKIEQAFTDGDINEYMRNKLLAAFESGGTDYLLDNALDDARKVSCCDVDNDKDYNIKFFIDNSLEDLVGDLVPIEPEDKDRVFLYIKDDDEEREINDTLDLGAMIGMWVQDRMSKKAHPNTMGIGTPHERYDVPKWVDTAKLLYKLLNESKMGREQALKVLTLDWDSDERYKFDRWLNYYESGNTEKYKVKTAKLKKEANDVYDLNLPSYLLDPNTRSNNVESRPKMPFKPEEKSEKQLKLERAKDFKRKMKGRLRSLRRLLDRYNETLPHHDLESIQDEMYALDKSITKLNVYASLEDCVIRSANKLERLGFVDGAEELYKFAKDPEAPMPEDALKPEEDPAPVSEEVVEALPPADSGEPDVSNIELNNIIPRLESVTKQLKSRDIVRYLASVDILLNELGLSSYFPELSDSQSKLIEAYSYASNRVDAVLSKLRGTGGTVEKMRARKPQGNSGEEKLSTREIKQQPVGQVKQELPAKQVKQEIPVK